MASRGGTGWGGQGSVEKTLKMTCPVSCPTEPEMTCKLQEKCGLFWAGLKLTSVSRCWDYAPQGASAPVLSMSVFPWAAEADSADIPVSWVNSSLQKAHQCLEAWALHSIGLKLGFWACLYCHPQPGEIHFDFSQPCIYELWNTIHFSAGELHY